MCDLSKVLISLELEKPPALYSYSDVNGNSPINQALSPIPSKGGIYGVYFKQIPPSVPTDGCVIVGDKTLLYVGESGNMYRRIKEHYKGTIGQSTLRLSLSVLFANQISSSSLDKEILLTNWMKDNAFVYPIANELHMNVEKAIIQQGYLPLNIENSLHPFSQKLKQMRDDAN